MFKMSPIIDFDSKSPFHEDKSAHFQSHFALQNVPPFSPLLDYGVLFI